MFRAGLLIFLAAVFAGAADFTIEIGPPVASREYVSKTADFVFRTEGCFDPAKVQVSAAAEGRINGERRSVALMPRALTTPGVYAVFHTWGPDGNWVIRLKATCGDTTAGALVPMNAHGFIRESAKFFPRAATDAETDTALKSLAR
jgi:hypothetical protein